MHINDVIWKEKFASKINKKHGVTTEEVEQILFSSQSRFRRQKKGRIQGEDVYVAYGQTHAGRYLVVFFIHKRNNAVLPISSRKMSPSERSYYGRHKKTY